MTSRRIHLSVVLFSVAMLVGIVFQNCSGVQFADVTAASASLEATDTPLDVGTAETKVGARDVPSLKVFVIVDNSFSMQKSQLNLAQSFSKLFSASGPNQLNRFNVTTFLLNTAQTNPDFGSPDLTTISQLQLKSDQILISPFSMVSSLWRTAAQNSGQVAGDNLGFQVLSPTPGSFQFLPAPVLGLSASSNGLAKMNQGMQKAPNESVDAMASEFQNRLTLLNSNRIPYVANSGDKMFAGLLDNESGLCGMARVLRNPGGFIAGGDQAVFVLVSDEDEADVTGRRCAQSFTQVTQADDLIKGRCETRSTVLSYSSSQKAPDTCRVGFENGYSYQVSWTETVKMTRVTYRRMDQPQRFSSPRTRVSYSVNSTVYKKTNTTLNYQVKTCVPTFEDGIRTGERCTYPAAPAVSVAGDQSSASLCLAAISAKGGEVSDKAKYPYSCVAVESDVGSCVPGDLACRSLNVLQTQSTVVDGSFATGPACVAQAKLISGAITDGTQPVTCAAASPATGNGTCPPSLVALGCVTSDPVYSLPFVDVSGDKSASCLATALALPGAAVDSGVNQPRCVVFDQSNPQTRSGTLLFAASADGGVTQSVGDCGVLKSKILPLVAGAPAQSQCSIKSIRQSSISGLATDSQGACTSVASSYCSSSSTPIRACIGSLVVGNTSTGPVALPSISREVNCDDLCAAHNNIVCAAKPGVVVTAATTVKQYFLQAYGPDATCSARISTMKVNDFADRKVTDKTLICMGSESIPQYLVQEGDPYRLNELVTEHVAGSVRKAANVFDPKMNLIEYITGRSKELFGASKPLLSTFIRRSSDPLVAGQVGSVGKNYELLAGALGGQVESVASNDYSPALSALGDVLNKRLERTFSVPKMKPEQTVRVVFLRKVGEADWKPLSANLWSANGNTVVLADSIVLNLEDDVKFEFY